MRGGDTTTPGPCVAIQLGQGPHQQQRKRKCPNEFEMPEDVSEDDELLLTSVLSVLCSLDICCAYSVQHTQQNTAFMIKGVLQEDSFEIGLDDLRFIHMVNPLRIEYVGVSRCGGTNELLVRVLNTKQRIMITEDTAFFICSRRRKMAKITQQAA